MKEILRNVEQLSKMVEKIGGRLGWIGMLGRRRLSDGEGLLLDIGE